MHLRTHVPAGNRGKYKHGDSEYIDGMIEHDEAVGSLLKALDDLGIANNTIVVYSSDNGPHMNTWPDGAMTPFRSEKNTNREGAFRVPCLVRWPGVIKPGTVTNELRKRSSLATSRSISSGDPDRRLAMTPAANPQTRAAKTPRTGNSWATTANKTMANAHGVAFDRGRGRSRGAASPRRGSGAEKESRSAVRYDLQ